MIIKGGSCAGAGRLAAHLLRADQNERVSVRELRGVGGDTLRDALTDMTAFAAGTNARKPFYHASINPRPSEPLNEAQWSTAVDRLEVALGLTGQPRIVVEHVKDGRAHRHVVWSRIDLARHRTIPDSHNYRKHEAVARDLEQLFGFAPVRGAHIGRGSSKRPERAPNHDEMQQGGRTSIDPQEAKAFITRLWRSTTTGQEFAAALTAAGWMLARGDRRDFVLIDPAGGVHSLPRRVAGARAADIRRRMVDVDPAKLLSVAEARGKSQDHGTRPLADIVMLRPTSRPAWESPPQRQAA